MVRVSVEDADGNILLQKRLATKKSYPGCWDTSAGGNITYPETYDEAVKRELAEEIGLRDVELKEVAHFYGEIVDPAGNKMNRFTKVYRTVVDPSTKFTPQPSEVSEVKWMSRADVVKLAEGEEITDGLRQVIEKYYRIG
jgi:isopentenyldiphosphate isomerase